MPARLHVVSLLIACAMGATFSHAAAEESDGRRFVRGTVERARRSLAIGPMIGAGVAYAPSPEHLEVPLTFGVGVALFDIPITGPRAIEEMITTRAKAKVQERVKASIAAGAPAPDEQELARMAAEVLAEVKAEILGQRPYVGRTLERPRLTLALEGTYLVRAADWQARITLGYGIKRLTLGPTIAGHFGDANGLYLGGELAAHLTPEQGPRPRVIDVFLRFDVGVTNATDDAHALGVGLRVMLDVI